MRTCVVSFFDSVNLGDLLIARGLRDLAAEFGPVERLSYSGDPFSFPDPDVLPRHDGPDVGGGRTFRARLLSTRVGHTAWRVKESISARHERIRGALGQADLLLLGGGNMIFDLDRETRSSDRFRYFVDTARQCKTPTFGISLGIGPFASARQHRDACRALDRCRWLTFRDRESLGLYLEHGRQPAEFGVDPVLLMGQLSDRPGSPSNRLAWNLVEPRLLGRLGGDRRQVILRAYVSALRALVSDGFVIDLFSTDRADEPFLSEIQRLVGSPDCRHKSLAGFAALLQFYREVDIVVGSRMHALIVAYTQGVPVVGLSWQQKVGAFFDITDRSGHCFSFLEPDFQRLRSLIDEAMTNPESFVIQEPDRARLRGLNASNVRVLSEFSSSLV